MYKFVFMLLLVVGLTACQEKQPQEQSPETNPISETKKKKIGFPAFDIQGHRGMRGYYPENTLEGFVFALDLGVTTLEMDAVIAADREVVLSHEPWFSSDICLDSEGRPIVKSNERELNIFEMNYGEIEAFKCGGFVNPRFPEQEKAELVKPRLVDVIDAVEKKIAEDGKNPVFYNIETKTSPEGDNIFHPEPKEFVDVLLYVIKVKEIAERTVIQSFDIRTLQLVHKKNPNIKLALLVGEDEDTEKKMKDLGFLPDIYSPNFNLLDKQQIEEFHKQNIKVIPWTVNNEDDIRELVQMGVDGIISDYPDRVVKVKKENEPSK